MYDEIGLFIFPLIFGFVAVVIAVRLSVNSKFEELFFQFKVMQKRLESTTESLNNLQEEIEKRLPQGVATNAGNHAEEQKDAIATPPQAAGNGPWATHTEPPTGEDMHQEDVEEPVAEVTTLSEQQRMGTPVATIEVPVQGVNAPANAPEGEPQQAEGELQGTDSNLHQAETPATCEVETSQAGADLQDNDAEQQDGDNETQGVDNEQQADNTEEQRENAAQEQPQLHVPVAAFVQDETEQERVEQAQEEPVLTGRAYLEAKYKHAATKGKAVNGSAMGADNEDGGFNYEKFIGENLCAGYCLLC